MRLKRLVARGFKSFADRTEFEFDSRLTGIMPPLSPQEALEVSTIYSLAAQPGDGTIFKERPYRAPHHSASMAAMIGGGRDARPGEISLAHRGVLFLDELPEFSRRAGRLGPVLAPRWVRRRPPEAQRTGDEPRVNPDHRAGR